MKPTIYGHMLDMPNVERYQYGFGLAILVGMCPDINSEPEKALLGRSGRRLAQLAKLEYPNEYLHAFDRVSLCETPGSFDMAQARKSVRLLASELHHRVIVLLGRQVATAFFFQQGLKFFEGASGEMMFLAEDGQVRTSHIGAVLFPHPSHHNRVWNDPKNLEKAGELLQRLAKPPKSRED